MENINPNSQIYVQNQETEDANQEYEVEKITDMRQYFRKNLITQKVELSTEYLIKWVGYEQLTWEPLENLNNCKELLKEFYKEHKKLLKNKKAKNGKVKKNKKNEIKKKTKSKKRNKNKRYNSLLKNNNKTKISKKIFLTQKIIGNINNYIISQNNLIVNKDKNDNDNIVLDKENINNDNFSIHESQQKIDKENSIENLHKDNESENDIKLKIINGEINEENNQINNIDYKNMERIYELEKLNFLDNKFMSLEQFKNCMGSDYEDKMNFDSIPYGTIDEKEEFLNKKRNNEIDDDNDENNKIIIKEINNLIIPKNNKDSFLINVTYLNKYDNKLYTKDIESNNKIIPREYLIKYYEYILFEKSKGKNYSKKLSFA